MPVKTRTMHLPPDSFLLPLARGALLVSRDHAVFCRIPPRDAAAVRRALANGHDAAALRPGLRADLDRHGFFGPPRAPKAESPSVQIQLTNACNLACEYCCTNSGRARTREVTFESMCDVVRRIPTVLGPGTRVALLGGEPLLVPWAVDLADEILALGLDLTIFTNGVPLADEALAQRVAGLMARGARVRISLGGPGAGTCDAISGALRYDAVLAAVRNLVHFGGRPTIDLMLVPGQLDDVVRELPKLRRQLPPGIPLSLGVLYHSGRETGAHMFGSRAELEAALDRIALETGETIPAPAPSPLTDRREGCTCALGHHVHVRSDGALFNCFKMEEKVGDLATTGFEAAVRAVRGHPHRAADLAECRDCPLATLCGGGCRSENLLYSGDPDVPPCGPWRVRVVSELLAEDRVSAVEWPVSFLLAEARARGIETPGDLVPRQVSRHMVDV
jgi:radical SAM protein with 4Fe4S-binding SPASM domain